MSSETDRIEKKIQLSASRQRVWRAIADSAEFGAWFGMKLDGPFVAGERLGGTITPTVADPAVGKKQEPYAGAKVELWIERIEPERVFSFRWHPFAIEKGVDYGAEPTTLITFHLADADGGVLLTVTETGFDAIPLARRAKAFAANDGGWTMQMTLIEKYLAQRG